MTLQVLSGYITATVAKGCSKCKTSTVVYTTNTTKTTLSDDTTVTITEPCENTEIFVVLPLEHGYTASAVTEVCSECKTSILPL